MIISHKHRFIFIKTNKTASTSIEIALSRFCGPNDVITPISPEDEATRRNLGYRGPQNFHSPHPGDNSPLFFNHISASEIKSRVAPHVWRDYFKFCTERNPWDRLISLYYWRNPTKPRPGLSEFIRSEVPAVLRQRGYGLYTIDDKVVVNRVCRYENLDQELEDVRCKIGLPEPLALPRAKSRFREDKRGYKDILSHDDGARIAAMFQREIDLFGYQW